MKDGQKCPAEAAAGPSDAGGEAKRLRLKIVHAYVEKEIDVVAGGNLVASIKHAAHAAFSLACLRLEVGGRPLIAPEQVAEAAEHALAIEVFGVKDKCSLPRCRNRVSKAGDFECKFCASAFCIRHHLPEEHKCQCIKKCKEEAAKKNNVRLIEGKCVGPKGIWN